MKVFKLQIIQIGADFIPIKYLIHKWQLICSTSNTNIGANMANIPISVDEKRKNYIVINRNYLLLIIFLD